MIENDYESLNVDSLGDRPIVQDDADDEMAELQRKMEELAKKKKAEKEKKAKEEAARRKKEEDERRR